MRQKKIKDIITLSALTAILFFLTSCTKDVPKEMMNTNKDIPTDKQKPDDSIHRNLMNRDDVKGNNESDINTDKKTEEILREADNADKNYEKTKSETDKKICIEKQLTAANYLMFEADLPPKEKFGQALGRYRRVLQLDPANNEAFENKQQIEDIYKSMGKPIPE